jgi:hypothetical protein
LSHRRRLTTGKCTHPALQIERRNCTAWRRNMGANDSTAWGCNDPSIGGTSSRIEVEVSGLQIHFSRPHDTRIE